MLGKMLGLPFEVAQAMAKTGTQVLDTVTGGRTIHIDRTHTIDGSSSKAWADEFQQNPSRLSPVAVGQQRTARGHAGHPFLGGPKVEIVVKDRQEKRLPDGRNQTVLELEYGGDYRGPGKMTITERRGGGLDWRDQWQGVENHSHLPARAAEIGHPIVSAVGASSIGRASLKRS